MSLTKEARDALPAGHFAVPGKRKLPIHDETHTRLAWDMVDRTKGLSPAERKAARARIKRRADELGMDTTEWKAEAEVTFEAMAVVLPEVADHPNRLPFRGVLTRVDEPSDEPPGGAGGKRVCIPAEVAEVALDSLANMAVDCDPDGDFDTHDPQFKIGVITAAEVSGSAINIEGFLYANDFPELCGKIRREKHRLGFSYEATVRILDQDADIWVVDRCVFTGAAILYKDKAAYRSTSLAAQAATENEMTADELKKAIADALAPLQATVNAQANELKELKAGRGASLSGPLVDQVTPHVGACQAAADKMEAAGIGTHPQMGHAAVLRRVAGHMLQCAVGGTLPHIFRDHDYPMGAAAAPAQDPATKKALEDSAAALKAATDEIASLKTLVSDLKAAADKAASTENQPQRRTLSADVRSLLAKHGITEEDASSGKVTLASIDKTLAAAGVTGQRAIETKLRLRAAGVLSDSRQAA